MKANVLYISEKNFFFFEDASLKKSFATVAKATILYKRWRQRRCRAIMSNKPKSRDLALSFVICVWNILCASVGASAPVKKIAQMDPLMRKTAWLAENRMDSLICKAQMGFWAQAVGASGSQDSRTRSRKSREISRNQLKPADFSWFQLESAKIGWNRSVHVAPRSWVVDFSWSNRFQSGSAGISWEQLRSAIPRNGVDLVENRLFGSAARALFASWKKVVAKLRVFWRKMCVKNHVFQQKKSMKKSCCTNAWISAAGKFEKHLVSWRKSFVQKSLFYHVFFMVNGRLEGARILTLFLHQK